MQHPLGVFDPARGDEHDREHHADHVSHDRDRHDAADQHEPTPDTVREKIRDDDAERQQRHDRSQPAAGVRHEQLVTGHEDAISRRGDGVTERLEQPDGGADHHFLQAEEQLVLQERRWGNHQHQEAHRHRERARESTATDRVDRRGDREHDADSGERSRLGEQRAGLEQCRGEHEQRPRSRAGRVVEVGAYSRTTQPDQAGRREGDQIAVRQIVRTHPDVGQQANRGPGYEQTRDQAGDAQPEIGLRRRALEARLEPSTRDHLRPPTRFSEVRRVP